MPESKERKTDLELVEGDNLLVVVESDDVDAVVLVRLAGRLELRRREKLQIGEAGGHLVSDEAKEADERDSTQRMTHLQDDAVLAFDNVDGVLEIHLSRHRIRR